jgi:TyrR family helix-turn-helix protein
VRILSATNRNIDELVEKKLFRRDLYYRLNVFPVKVPALRDRSADVPALIMHFIRKYNSKFNINREIEEDAVSYLKGREWPGNIRELENVVQRLLINSKNDSVTLLDVMKELHGDVPGGVDKSHAEADKSLPLDELVGNYEKGLLKYACEKYGSTRKAAKAIGISQTQLVRKKKMYGI